MMKESRLLEVAKLFLKLGVIGFGGPAVHIAMMEEEVVRKRAWMSHQHFLDLVGATNLTPGPNSTEMTMHCGHERAGWRGLIVAGCCFIIPAVIITAFFAWAYQRYGQLPQVEQFIYGIKPAIVYSCDGPSTEYTSCSCIVNISLNFINNKWTISCECES